MTPDEQWARMAHLYVMVCTRPLGSYSREIDDALAEYFELKKVLFMGLSTDSASGK